MVEDKEEADEIDNWLYYIEILHRQQKNKR